MPRTVLTVTVPIGPYPSGTVAPGSLDTPFVAADSANGNSFPMGGEEVLLVRNIHATNPGTFTILSSADQYGRLGNITTYSLAAGAVATFDFRGAQSGWRQSDGHVYLDSAGTGTIQFLILK